MKAACALPALHMPTRLPRASKAAPSAVTWPTTDDDANTLPSRAMRPIDTLRRALHTWPSSSMRASMAPAASRTLPSFLKLPRLSLSAPYHAPCLSSRPAFLPALSLITPAVMCTKCPSPPPASLFGDSAPLARRELRLDRRRLPMRRMPSASAGASSIENTSRPSSSMCPVFALCVHPIAPRQHRLASTPGVTGQAGAGAAAAGRRFPAATLTEASAAAAAAATMRLPHATALRVRRYAHHAHTETSHTRQRHGMPPRVCSVPPAGCRSLDSRARACRFRLLLKTLTHAPPQRTCATRTDTHTNEIPKARGSYTTAARPPCERARPVCDGNACRRCTGRLARRAADDNDSPAAGPATAPRRPIRAPRSSTETTHTH
mmetsp:Transcript_9629/g.33854  ORF Transcript_9629/g.33854 Transcript_9629/m.33854 type:complete len:377 (+) Transcript_9629:856-1986(+)